MPLPKKRTAEDMANLKRCQSDVEEAIRLVGKWNGPCTPAAESLRSALSILWAHEDGADMEGAAGYGRRPWYPRGAKQQLKGEAFNESIRKDNAMRRVFEQAGFKEPNR